MRPVELSLTLVPDLVSFLTDIDRFRAGGRPPVVKVRGEFDPDSCCRSTVDTAATVGRSLIGESVDELGVASVAELNVAIEGVDVDIVVKTTTTALITCELSNTPA